MKISGLLLLVPLQFFSCEFTNDDPTTTKGKVIDKQTGAAVPNATMTVLKGKTNSGSASFSTIFIWNADDNGHFDISFHPDEDDDYILMASTPSGYYTAWENTHYITKGSKNHDVIIPAQPPAWVKVNLVDEAPLGVARLDLWGFRDDFTEPVYPTTDTSFIKLADGGLTQTIHYTINDTSGGAPINHIPISPASLDTISIEIKF